MKRAFDIIVSGCLLLALSPLLLIVAGMVRLKIGKPVFFVQARPGLHEKPFKLVKFRSMTNAADAEGNPLPDTKRLEPFGQFIRSTSLDELPELWNVFRGEMSIVGPRPLLMKYLSRYNHRQSLRHSIKPGITGWAQVNGRNATHWNDRLEMDVWYVENRSMLLDCKILLKTVYKVLTREGVSSATHVTKEEFRGNSDGQ